MTPFLSGLEFVPHASLSEDFKLRLETKPNDDDLTRGRKKALRNCVNVLASKHSNNDKYLVELYKNPNTACSFVKKVVTNIGLHLACSDNKRVGDHRLRRRVIATPAIKFALALAHRRSSGLRSLLPMLLASDNLSQPDKEWVREAVDLYNQKASGMGVASLEIPPRRNIGEYAVIQRRLAERVAENNAAGLEAAPTMGEVAATARQRRALAEMLERAISEEEAFDDRRRLAEFAITDTVEVPDDETLSFQGSQVTETSSLHSQNPFMLALGVLCSCGSWAVWSSAASLQYSFSLSPICS